MDQQESPSWGTILEVLPNESNPLHLILALIPLFHVLVLKKPSDYHSMSSC